MSGVQQRPSSGNGRGCARLIAWLDDIPLITRINLFFCVFIYFYTLYDGDLNPWSVCAFPVVYESEYYRIITAAYFHVNLLHILMNMMSYVYLGAQVEQKIGTLPTLGISIMFTILIGALYVFMNEIWYLINMHGDPMEYCFRRDPGENYQSKCAPLVNCAVGFSGVIFGFIMVDCYTTTNTTRNLFGMCNVSVWVYPWVMLVFLSLMMPGVSFLGHLSGILIGFLYSKGVLNFITVKRSVLLDWESRPSIQRLVNHHVWRKTPQASPLATANLPCVLSAETSLSARGGWWSNVRARDAPPIGDDASQPARDRDRDIQLWQQARGGSSSAFNGNGRRLRDGVITASSSTASSSSSSSSSSSASTKTDNSSSSLKTTTESNTSSSTVVDIPPSALTDVPSASDGDTQQPSRRGLSQWLTSIRQSQNPYQPLQNDVEMAEPGSSPSSPSHHDDEQSQSTSQNATYAQGNTQGEADHPITPSTRSNRPISRLVDSHPRASSDTYKREKARQDEQRKVKTLNKKFSDMDVSPYVSNIEPNGPDVSQHAFHGRASSHFYKSDETTESTTDKKDEPPRG